jgi:hypothetical protein
VNGVNINNENHVQVVERIKANPKSVDLLVVDAKCYAYYEERQLVVLSTWDNVAVLANEPRSLSADTASTSGVTGSPTASPVPTPSPNPSNASSSRRVSSAASEEKREKEAERVGAVEATPVDVSAVSTHRCSFVTIKVDFIHILQACLILCLTATSSLCCSGDKHRL